jgi:mono/diheme cytochrome c family protein
VQGLRDIMTTKRGMSACAAALLVCAVVTWTSADRAGAAPFQGTLARAEEPATSILNGVYTPDQASRGQQTFQKLCSSCHTVEEHTGRRFGAKWAGTSVGDLFDLVSNTMPENEPGSLTKEDYAGVLAFFLKQSGYPPGETELPIDPARLAGIRIEALPR